MWLLLWPQHLSADWSFNCLPLVQRLDDPRNLAAAALYAYLLYCLLAARPWGAALQLLADLRQLGGRPPGRRPQVAAAAAARAVGNAKAGKANGAAAASAAPAQPQPAAAAQQPRALMAARWRLVVVAGLVVAPFFPASNVLFYVGAAAAALAQHRRSGLPARCTRGHNASRSALGSAAE
jgi:hypothetical protein